MAHRLAIYRDFIVHRDVDRPATEFEPRVLAKRGTININGDNNRLHPVLRYGHHRPSLFLLVTLRILATSGLVTFKSVAIFVMIRVCISL